ncbi:MAG: cytochrome c oxidase subunit II [Gaiellaceae bacterium]
MRWGSLVTMLLIGAVAFAATAAVAIFIPWLPESASKEREGIDFTFWLATWICIGIFAIVAAVIGYSFLKFRVRPDDDSDGPPIHGHTGLEIAWTAVPFVLVIVLGVASAVVLTQNDRARGSNVNQVGVLAQQFAWMFEHPNGVTDGTLRVPVDRSTLLTLRARDVIHSFWVPEFGQKRDAVPGIETELVITPTRTGEYTVICTELCGLGHSLMRTKVIVMPQAEYDRWLEEGAEAEGPADGGALFLAQGCGGCHAFAPAGTTAQVGPPLDGLADAALVRLAIVEPDAEIAEGYAAGVMPKTFGEQLSEEQLDALVQYLTGGGG